MTVRIPPLQGLLAELTHRCPLQCPYCSNPLELAAKEKELATEVWADVFEQAAAMGALHVHLSGGEPLARADIAGLTRAASQAGLYTNLITSAVALDEARAQILADCGLDHVQISIQGVEAAAADRVAHYEGAMARKSRAAKAVKAAGMALTVNAVMHRQNLHELPQVIDLALDWGAERLEVAHVQYYAWALANRDALLPSRVQVDAATTVVQEAAARLKGQMVIDYVVPDYYGERPKACMGGWGRQVMVIAPDGATLPCHAARTIPGLLFDSVRTMRLDDIWRTGEAFQRYRGTDWMPDPCRTCDRREIDWGGCRCQALALAGDAGATDPACALSPKHHVMAEAVAGQASDPPPFRYRRYNG